MKPLSSSHSMMPAMPMTLPGATDSACVATNSRAGTRCERGVDGRQQHRRLVAALDARQPRQRGHALRHDAGIRRHAVVGQAIPGREFHHLDLGPEERQRARQRRHALAVAADHGERNRRRVGSRGNGARQIGQHQAFGAVGDLRQRQRLAGLERVGGRFRGQNSRSRQAFTVEVAQPAEQRAY